MVCSECGLDWDLHPENPRRRDCIELLKNQPKLTEWPWRWTTQYCNWGHPNCYIWHYNEIWYTDTGMTFAGDTADSTDTNVIQLLSNDDDDPDMGVTANVG
jgi:hypothetical protein